MNQEQLIHIINNHYRKVSTYIAKISENFDVEDIHGFRVEYKKLRALLRMLSLRKKVADKLKISGKLKRYYKIAGEIRDLQLLQLRIISATKLCKLALPGYLDLLRQRIEKLKAVLDEFYRKGNVKGFQKSSEIDLPDQFPPERFKEYVNQKWDSVCTIIRHRDLSDDAIHTIRKNLKDMLYNQKLFKDVEKRVVAVMGGGKKQAFFNKFLKELGNYQDQCFAVALLQSGNVNRLNSYERKQLQQIKVQWKTDKKASRQLLIKQLKAEVAMPIVKHQNKSPQKPM